MGDIASSSGAFMRPTLLDYLIVAEELEFSVGLRVFIGRLELGLIGFERGRVVVAELPGSQGDSALALLVRMPGTRTVAELWSPRAPNVEAQWRDIVPSEQLASSSGRAWRLGAVRDELGELGPDSKRSTPNKLVRRVPLPNEPLLLRVAGILLDWAAADACLDDEVERAHALLTQRVKLCPAELICAANLERLHLRLLADDIVTSVAEES